VALNWGIITTIYSTHEPDYAALEAQRTQPSYSRYFTYAHILQLCSLLFTLATNSVTEIKQSQAQGEARSGFNGKRRTHTRWLVDGLCMDLEPRMVGQHCIDLIGAEPACSRFCHQLVKVQVCPPATKATYTSKTLVLEAAESFRLWRVQNWKGVNINYCLLSFSNETTRAAKSPNSS
jgi:hypothetical protein